MSNEEILARRIDKHLECEQNEPMLLNTDELILCMLALRLQVIDIDNASGGVSDYVCEWKSASDGEFIQNPHTKRLYSNEPSMKNIYCNTCGKKIKVVE